MTSFILWSPLCVWHFDEVPWLEKLFSLVLSPRWSFQLLIIYFARIQGMELYPRIGKSFDIKVFTNCRFGMMSWAVLALTYCIKQVSGHVTYIILFSCVLNGILCMYHTSYACKHVGKYSQTNIFAVIYAWLIHSWLV